MSKLNSYFDEEDYIWYREQNRKENQAKANYYARNRKENEEIDENFNTAKSFLLTFFVLMFILILILRTCK